MFSKLTELGAGGGGVRAEVLKPFSGSEIPSSLAV